MYILGINGGANPVGHNDYKIAQGAHHDAAAALLRNGQLLSAFEEERLNRIKHTNKWPSLAVKTCLSRHKLSLDQIEYFTFSLSPETLGRILGNYFGGEGLSAPSPREFLRVLMEEHFQYSPELEKIQLFEHHYVHAVTAFYPSPFDNALVLTVDGSGGEYSGSVYEGFGNLLSALKMFPEEQSLGNFYQYGTYLLGFGLFDEYKVMGLAPYGNGRKYAELFESFYELLPEGNYRIYQERMIGLRELLPPRGTTGSFSEVHKDIAAALQDTLEKIVFHILEHYRNLTKHTQLCLAGGVALNCTLNGKITTSGLFKDVYVFPGANDSGLPIGSALAAHFKFSKNPRRIPVKSLYLGTALGDKDVIAGELKRWEPMISWTPIKNIPLKAAQLLAAGKVLGWVQGRSEFAARALGNRSIIADPRPAANKERINYMIKKREGFRPFAPSVLAEYAREYFEIIADTALFANMNFAIGVRPAYRACLAAVTHVDGTARLQCVSRKDNDKYWRLINYFREITGIPVLLNTSFNNNVEPIVDTVRDAVVCFLTTRLDFLIIDDFLISKDEVTYLNIKRLYASIAKYTVLKKTETRGSRSEFKPVIKFEIGNTYNEITEEVDEEVFDLLSSVDGTSTLEDIMDGHKIEDTEREERLMKSVTRLWEKRMIMLEPEANGCR